MSDQALHQQSLVALRANLASKQLSATDVAQHFLQRAQADTHHAFLAFNEEATLAQAAAAQQKLQEVQPHRVVGLALVKAGCQHGLRRDRGLLQLRLG